MRIRTASERKDQGFTLIELLVVVVIIGVLAAIAIPVFLSQREKAADAAIKSDLKNAATIQETYLVDNPSGYAETTAALEAPGYDFQESTANTITVLSASSDGYCMSGTSTGSDSTFYYDSGAGGLLEGTATCTASSY